MSLISKQAFEETEQVIVKALEKSEYEQGALEAPEELKGESTKEIVQQSKEILKNYLKCNIVKASTELGELLEGTERNTSLEKFEKLIEKFEKLIESLKSEDLKLFLDKLSHRYDLNKFSNLMLLRKLALEMMM